MSPALIATIILSLCGPDDTKCQEAILNCAITVQDEAVTEKELHSCYKK